MYQQIYRALQSLSKGDRADLKRCNLKSIANCPAYFRVLKISQAKDNSQTQRILFLLSNVDVTDQEEGKTVAMALIDIGVKERQVIQITRSGDNGIDYLKRQLVRCKNIQLNSLGKLAQYWGDSARRQLLKEYILSNTEKFESEPTQ